MKPMPVAALSKESVWAIRLLGVRVRIPPGTWKPVCLWVLCNMRLSSLWGVLLSVLCVWVWACRLDNEEVRATGELRAMNMYTLTSSVPELRPGQLVFASRQRQWLFPPSECRPDSYLLYSKDNHDRHEATAQNTLEWGTPPIRAPLKTLAVFQI
jgi:hypothetical protein